MTIRAVVFDFDGVILDSASIKTHAFAALFEDRPNHVEAIVAYHLANEGISRHEKIRVIHRDILQEPLPEPQRAALARRFEELVLGAVMTAPFIPGAPETLAALQGRVPMFVASGTPDAELNRIIDARGLRQFFVRTCGSPPSKAVILRSIIEEYGLAAGEVVMVGDAVTDWEAARQCGVRFIGIGTDKFPPEIGALPDLVGLDRHIGTVFG